MNMEINRGPRSSLLQAFALFLALPLTAGLAWSGGPQIQQWTTDAGTRVHLVESRSIPMIDIRIDFAAGSAYDPPGREGLAGLTRDLLESGTRDLDEQALAESVADTAARIGGSTDNDRAGLTIRTLSSETERDAAVAIAAELLAHPTFPQPALDRERMRRIAALRDSLTRPSTLAARHYSAAVFADHPYGRLISLESLQAIERDDLVAFHRQRYVADNATISIVGDVDRTTAEQIALTLTRDLGVGAPDARLPAPALPPASTEHVPHPSAQAHIAAGMPGLAREDPDYYPLLVGNHVLGGGGFTSRLMREVRDRRGFAYSVYSYFHPHRVPGPFQIGLQTRGAQAEEALEVVREVLADFIADGPTEDELLAARDNIVNGFGLRLDSNGKILDHVAMIAFYELPLDWLETYPEHIAAVTADDVRNAFARRIRPENLVVVVAGGDGDRADDAPPPGNEQSTADTH